MIFFSFPALSATDPLDLLKQAFLQEQKKGEFTGYYGTCINITLFTKSGPLTSSSARQCFSSYMPKSYIERFVTEKGLAFVYRNPYLDLVQVPNGTVATMPKGNAYYYVQYDASGNASEVTVMNDALP